MYSDTISDSTNKNIEIQYTYVDDELDVHEELHKIMKTIKLLIKTKKDGTH